MKPKAFIHKVQVYQKNCVKGNDKSKMADRAKRKTQKDPTQSFRII